MTLVVDYPFPGYSLMQYRPDAGLVEFAKREKACGDHLEAEAFLRFQQAIDLERGLSVEMVAVRPDVEDVVLPRSLKGVSQVTFAGTYPYFVGFNHQNNLVSLLPEGCVVRAEFLGKIGAPNHIKYFSTL